MPHTLITARVTISGPDIPETQRQRVLMTVHAAFANLTARLHAQCPALTADLDLEPLPHPAARDAESAA